MQAVRVGVKLYVLTQAAIREYYYCYCQRYPLCVPEESAHSDNHLCHFSANHTRSTAARWLVTKHDSATIKKRQVNSAV